MANSFSFQMDESFLTAYRDYLQQLKRDHPDEELVVQISVDLVPDGIGYAITAGPEISVVDKKQQPGPPDGREVAQNESDG